MQGCDHKLSLRGAPAEQGGCTDQQLGCFDALWVMETKVYGGMWAGSWSYLGEKGRVTALQRR